MKKVKYISTIALIVIGCIHIGFSIFEFDSISQDALWFVSGGLSIIFAGLFNLFILKNERTEFSNGNILRLTNLLISMFFVLMVIQLPMIPGFVGVGCSLFLLFCNH